MRIAEVEVGQDSIDLEAEVVEVSEPRIVDTKFGLAKVASATLRDETGTIRLNLWRSQTEEIKAGDKVRIEGAFTKAFGGRPELNVGSRGRILVEEGLELKEESNDES